MSDPSASTSACRRSGRGARGFEPVVAGDSQAGLIESLPAFHERLPWLGGDLQTLRNRLRPPPDPPPLAERLLLPLSGDAGALSAALSLPPAGRTVRDRAILLVHGLGGCEESAYMLLMAGILLDHGYPVLRLNLRGAGPSAAHSRAPYHAGLTGDMRDALEGIARQLPALPVVGMGFSLGGHLLVRLACEDGGAVPLAGLVSVSAPLDMAVAQRRIAHPRNRVYERYIVSTMHRDLKAGTPLPRRLYDCDDQCIAPAHGFAGADDYYRRASAISRLATLAIPAVILHADNDPWIPARSYMQASWPRRHDLSVILTHGGGHVGFHARGLAEPWYAHLALRFLACLDDIHPSGK